MEMKNASKVTEEKKKEMEESESEAMNKKKKDLVTSFWNSMSTEAKKDVLKIKISDLITHFSSSSDMNQIISEAVSWYDTNKTWKFWHCCKCDEKFADKGSFRLHLATHHFGSLSPKMQSIMPIAVDKRWSELLLECPWEPLDASATAQILTTDKNKCKEKKSYVVSNDPVRKELLDKIQGLFELLVSHKYLSESTLHYVIKSTIQELQGLPIGSHILSEGLDQTPLCICFLGPTMLAEILEFLKEISQSCGIGIYSDEPVEHLQDLAQNDDAQVELDKKKGGSKVVTSPQQQQQQYVLPVDDYST